MSEIGFFIEGMPKAELHVHLEGTLEPELKFQLAARNSVDLPYRSAAEMRAAYAFDDLPSFLAVYYEGMSVDSAMETLTQSLPYRDWIAGVGLDSDERGNPPVKFKAVFDRARSEGYRLTMHCDVDQEDSVAHIWQCLNDIGVERIDHGVNCLEDDALVARLKGSGVGLTVCPISNSYVSDGLKAHEIKAMLGRSLRVTVNSDDPAYFPGYIG